MAGSIHRNRVIYQSEALFISPDATGYHYTGKGGYGLMTPPLNSSQSAGGINEKGQLVGWKCGEDWPEWNANGEDPFYAKAHGSVVKQLKRIQSANYGFTINRTDINQFGHLSKLDSIVIESPTVNLDFSYYLLDGYNERHIEFITNGTTNSLSGLFAPEVYQAGNNFFILTTSESRDTVLGDVDTDDETKSVISLGNGYMTDYTVDIAVGSVPTASVTVEGMNIRSDIGATGNNLPAIDGGQGRIISDAWLNNQKGVCRPEGGCTGLFSLPPATSGYEGCETDIAALRPGDVVLSLDSSEQIAKLTTGSRDKTRIGTVHIQSASLNVPMARSNLERIGSTFGFTKAAEVPVTVTLSVQAILSDIKESNMVDLICDCEENDVSITLYKPECVGCQPQSEVAMKFSLKGAKLDSENFSSSIGDNKTVDLTFSTQIAGADDKKRGFFIYGSESIGNNGQAPGWVGLDGKDNEPFFTEVPPDAEEYDLSKLYAESEVIQRGNRFYQAKITLNHYNG